MVTGGDGGYGKNGRDGGEGDESGETREKANEEGKGLSVRRRGRCRRKNCYGRVDGRQQKAPKEVLADLKNANTNADLKIHINVYLIPPSRLVIGDCGKKRESSFYRFLQIKRSGPDFKFADSFLLNGATLTLTY